MSESSNASDWRDDRTPAEIVRDRVEMLGATFSRKVSDQMIVVFQEALAGYSKEVLKIAFVKAEREMERFPTPKMMRLLCNENMPSEAWRYRYRTQEAKDPETGRPIQIKIDPETGEKLYRADDCPEGRMFLAKLRELAKRKRREPGEEG